MNRELYKQIKQRWQAKGNASPAKTCHTCIHGLDDLNCLSYLTYAGSGNCPGFVFGIKVLKRVQYYDFIIPGGWY